MTRNGDLDQSVAGGAWVTESCTLPTLERPLRIAEFDDLFATALRRQERISPTRLRWVLDPSAEAAARDLTGREASCCSFFTFTVTCLTSTAGEQVVEIAVEVPPAQADVLEALEQRARVRAGIMIRE